MNASPTSNNAVHAKRKQVAIAVEEQFGFSFADDTPSYAELPAGSWLSPMFTTAEFIEGFARAEHTIESIVGPGRPLFAAALAAARAQHAEMLEHEPERPYPYSLWRVKVEPTRDELARFLEHCTQLQDWKQDGFTFKVRTEQSVQVAGMYVEGLGSLIARVWSIDNFAIDYCLSRDTFFLESFRDSMRHIEAAASVFMPAYCGDKIAFASEACANVPTFTIGNREYINSGTMSHGKRQQCTALTFCPIADWHGPTYSYRTQIDAWNEGRTERADRRGLVVRVRGQLVVVDGAAVVYDDNATGYQWLGSTENDTTPEDSDQQAEIG